MDQDKLYAQELGLAGSNGKRKVRRLGGAEKLKSLSPEARAVLLFPKCVPIENTGLTVRGIKRAKDIRIQ